MTALCAALRHESSQSHLYSHHDVAITCLHQHMPGASTLNFQLHACWTWDSYRVFAMPFVTDVTDGTSPSAAFFAFRAAFFFAALDLAAAFALSKSARQTFSSSMQTCVSPF